MTSSKVESWNNVFDDRACIKSVTSATLADYQLVLVAHANFSATHLPHGVESPIL